MTAFYFLSNCIWNSPWRWHAWYLFLLVLTKEYFILIVMLKIHPFVRVFQLAKSMEQCKQCRKPGEWSSWKRDTEIWRTVSFTSSNKVWCTKTMSCLSYYCCSCNELSTLAVWVRWFSVRLKLKCAAPSTQRWANYYELAWGSWSFVQCAYSVTIIMMKLKF